MNIKEYCKFLGISEPTIYNWKKEKPNLYDIVMQYKKEKIDIKKNQNELKLFNENLQKELLNLFEKLNEKEKKYYITDIKARILKKEIENKE